MGNIRDIILSQALEKKASVLKLYDNQKVPVGAVYLGRIQPEQLAICETISVSSKYYLYLHGVAIFFTYFTLE